MDESSYKPTLIPIPNPNKAPCSDDSAFGFDKDDEVINLKYQKTQQMRPPDDFEHVRYRLKP